MQFSIIVPVYNVDQYLKECLDGVLKQTYTDYEVILIDDGSLDNSPGMCDDYAQKDSRIHVVHQKNAGLSAARNAGTVAAKGQYILYLDSDDYWSDSEALSKLKDYCYTDVVIFGYRKFFEATSTFSPPWLSDNTKSLKAKEDFSKYYTACAWNKAIKRSLFSDNDLLFHEGIRSEDIDWCARLLCYAQSFSVCYENFYVYRQRKDSISHTVDIRHLHDIRESISDSMKLTPQTEYDHVMKQYLSYQLGTYLFCCAANPEGEAKILFYEAEEWKTFLRYSSSKKIKLLNVVAKLGGFSFLYLLCKLYSKVRK